MKNKLSVFIIAAFLAVFISCARSSDVVATYSTGNVTRGELYSWLTLNHYDIKTITKKRDQQKSKLTSLAVEKISNEEAKKSGFSSNPDIMIMSDLIKKKTISQEYLEKKIFPSSKASEQIVFTESLFFRKADSKFKGHSQEKLQAALNDCAKGVPFPEISRKYSDGIWVIKAKTTVTRAYPIKEYGNAAFSMKKGEYTKNPIITDSGTYIIYAQDIKTVSLNDAVTQKKDDSSSFPLVASLIKERIKTDLITQLSASSPLNEKALDSSDLSQALFSINGTAFTVGNFNGIYSVFAARRTASPVNDKNMRNTFLKDIYAIELIYDKAIKEKFPSNELLNQIEQSKNSMIAREYMLSDIKKNITVSNEDIQEALKSIKKPRKGEAPLSNEALRARVYDKKMSQSITSWRERKLKEYSVSIKTSKLEGK